MRTSVAIGTAALVAAAIATPVAVVWLATDADEESLDPGELEARRAACGPAPADPVLFVHQAITGDCRVDPALAARRLDRLSIEVESESANERVVVATVHSMTDDSVESERTRVRIRRADDGAAGARGWTIVQVGKSWACWPGRGHGHYDTTPCS